MGTSRPGRDDELDEIDAIVDDPELTDVEGAVTGSLDGAGSDEPIDPAMAPVIEAGGGVAEGFEQSEAALVENAEEGRPDATGIIAEDAADPEAEPDRGVYGDADHERRPGDEAER